MSHHKKPDLVSTLVAAAIGAGIMYLVQKPLVCGDQCDMAVLGPYQMPIVGAIVGMGVQAGLRYSGVS